MTRAYAQNKYNAIKNKLNKIGPFDPTSSNIPTFDLLRILQLRNFFIFYGLIESNRKKGVQPLRLSLNAKRGVHGKLECISHVTKEDKD